MILDRNPLPPRAVLAGLLATGLAAFCLHSSTAGSTALQEDSQQIRQIRNRSNQAIKDRDLNSLRQTWVPQVVVVASSGSVFSGSAEMEGAFKNSFQDPSFGTYLRSPESIQISQDRRFAAERGHWQGVWDRDDGQMKVSGSYQAQWIRVEDEWKIRAELFVALSCSGSAGCADR